MKQGTNIAAEVFRDLQRRILAGELAAGERLPPERELAGNYGTNRNTLREAIRRLEQSRLVTVRQGQGVTVNDFRRFGTIEILGPFLEHGTNVGERATVLMDLLRSRTQVLEYAMELAMTRSEPSDLAVITDLTNRLVAAHAAQDRQALALGYAKWISAVIDASHSLLVRWIANPFLEFNRNLMERFPALWILDPSFPPYLMDSLKALLSKDRELAVSANTKYYQKVDAIIFETVGQLLPKGDLPKGES